MKGYVHKDDAGSTSLTDGTLAPKDHNIITCLGELDELNANIGFLMALIHADGTLEFVYAFLANIQNTIYEIGKCIKTGCNIDDHSILMSEVVKLEAEIDRLTKLIPLTKHVMLPSGDQIASYMYVVRSVCRRTERSIVLNSTTSQSVLQYINRLSSYLGVLARYTNYSRNISETIYVDKRKQHKKYQSI